MLHNDANAAARGAVRDVLTSLQNLAVLLRSPMVGPKALKPLMPELLSGVEAFRSASGILTVKTPGVKALLEPTESAVLSRWAGALQQAGGSAMAAKDRLRLEEALEEAAPALDAIRQNLELAQCCGQPAVDLDLATLLQEPFLASTRAEFAWGHTATLFTDLASEPGFGVHLAPRVLMPLIQLSLGVLRSESGADSQRLLLSGERLGQTVTLRFRPQPAEAPRGLDCLLLRPPAALPDQGLMVNEYAVRIGVGVRWTEPGVDLRLPAALMSR